MNFSPSGILLMHTLPSSVATKKPAGFLREMVPNSSETVRTHVSKSHRLMVPSREPLNNHSSVASKHVIHCTWPSKEFAASLQCWFHLVMLPSAAPLKTDPPRSTCSKHVIAQVCASVFAMGSKLFRSQHISVPPSDPLRIAPPTSNRHRTGLVCCVSLASRAPDSRSQQMTVASSEALQSTSWINSRHQTEPSCPFNSAMLFPVSRSHRLTARSTEPLKSEVPEPSKQVTGPLLPSRTLSFLPLSETYRKISLPTAEHTSGPCLADRPSHSSCEPRALARLPGLMGCGPPS
mmetsp:Transcript_104906/g.295392  ORF Transcript_104906/g.295392 Transcript_104906/m.295392 type:complete len:292 (-) Transcript_104906:123-998(-)